ncbi:non-structural maintenance of chromosomes element 4 [Chloropicon roscoffensis]|uniref:Non-structural maintenance of chromosomes element 4 n=1 Tax=Chloropicon roscoffensis TaxID=1461544 RepID=A0A7S3CAC8_9CHLO
MERRKIRDKYRDLIVLTEENDGSAQLDDPDKLKEILHTANKLHDHVTKPREHAADTELLQTLAASNLASAKRNLLTGKRLNTAKDLVTSLKCEYLRGWTPEQSSKTQRLEDFSWGGLGAFACEYLNTVVGMTTMFGPFQDLAPKAARQASRRRGRERLGELVNPDELEDAAACCQEQQETDKNMEEMMTILRDSSKLDHHGRVGFSELVFNPKSFAQTVENIFTLSFLVKDGRVTLADNDDPSKSERILVGATGTSGRTDPEVVSQVQYISSFSMRVWRKMKEELGPNSVCLMAHRTTEDLLRMEIPESPEASPSRRRGKRPVHGSQSAASRRRLSV